MFSTVSNTSPSCIGRMITVNCNEENSQVQWQQCCESRPGIESRQRQTNEMPIQSLSSTTSVRNTSSNYAPSLSALPRGPPSRAFRGGPIPHLVHIPSKICLRWPSAKRQHQGDLRGGADVARSSIARAFGRYNRITCLRVLRDWQLV